MAVTIQVLRRGDEDVLQNVAQGVFDNPIDPALVAEFLNDERHHIAVAVEDGCVVGFATAVDYIHPDKPRELWINEVSVAPTHRGRKLGKTVLRAIFNIGATRGCRTAWVLTDRANQAAMALYKSVGGVEGIDGSGTANRMIGYSFSINENSN